MNLKKFLYIILIAGFGLTSCSDFLSVRPVGSTDEVTFLTREGVDQVITSMYAKMYGGGQNATLVNLVWGDVLGAAANKGSTASDQPDWASLEMYSISTNNSYFNAKWRDCYNGVFKANVVISLANKIEDELRGYAGEEKDFYTEAIAQARFIRGLYHFECIKVFGAAVPYVGTEEYASSVNPKVSNVDESGNYIYIWDKVEEDLQYAYDNLPDTWAVERGNINKWAAAAMLAKVKIYRASPYNNNNGAGVVSKWTEAKNLLEVIMANGKQNDGKKFTLANTYEELWVAGKSDWTGESVFDLQEAIVGTQGETNSTPGGIYYIGMAGALGAAGFGFYMPTYDIVHSHMVDANGLPLIDLSYRDKPAISTIEGSTISTDLSVFMDPRVDLSTGRFGTPYWDYTVLSSVAGWIRDLANGGPFLNKKYIKKRADNGSHSVATVAVSSDKNTHLIRYAEILLWYAEVLIETGNHQGACEYVNQVRARAANWYLQAADPANMTPTTSSWILDDKVNGTTGANAAGNYRIGLWPESQFATKEGALTALRFERQIELCLEGHHWFDYARWGIAGTKLNSYLEFEKQHMSKFSTSVYNPAWVMWPIPQQQIITMEGVLVQNEVWK